MKQIYFSIILLIISVSNSSAQLVVPHSSGGPVTSGSWVLFQSGGTETSIQENWGLNLSGGTTRPVKIFNTSLLVGYTSGGEDFGSGNALVSGKLGIGTKSPSAKIEVFSAYNSVNNVNLKMFYDGSWGTPDYANNYRFIDIASTEGNKIFQLNGYGVE